MRFFKVGYVVVALLFITGAKLAWSGTQFQGEGVKTVVVPSDQPVYYAYPEDSAPYSGLEVIALLFSVIGTFLGGAALGEAKTAQRQAQEAKAAAEQVRKLLEDYKASAGRGSG